MNATRRQILRSGLVLASSLPLGACAGAQSPANGLTRVHVMGVIHGRHRTSERYSLDVLREAVRAAKPDLILSEIPPDRIDQAVTSFRETGAVDEPRTQVFPEYTDVVFPLSREMDFRILGTAGWTREIADNRRAALERIQNDPMRAEEWAEHRAALRQYRRDIAGKGDDPVFIHTPEFDRLVEASRTPYQQYFDKDLGPGGWTQINAAHTNLINSALDTLSGQGKTALIMFGNAHKYMILRSLEQRDDIDLLDARALFA